MQQHPTGHSHYLPPMTFLSKAIKASPLYTYLSKTHNNLLGIVFFLKKKIEMPRSGYETTNFGAGIGARPAGPKAPSAADNGEKKKAEKKKKEEEKDEKTSTDPSGSAATKKDVSVVSSKSFLLVRQSGSRKKLDV